MTVKNFFEKYQNGNEMVDIDTILRFANNHTLNELVKKYNCPEAIIMYLGQYDRICVCGNEGDFDRSFDDNTPMNEVIDYLIGEMRKEITIKDYLANNDANNLIQDDNVSIVTYDDGKSIELTITITTEDDELETMIESNYDTRVGEVIKEIETAINDTINPRTYHIKGYMDMQSMIEVNFGENEFKTLKEAYKAAKENLEYCDMEITEPSTELRILLTSNEIEIWNEKPKVHFKQQRPRTYKELEKIINEVFLS